MRVLHLVAGNRWTGAAAPAFAEVEALRDAGLDAHYAYVGAYRLEAKIGHRPFAHAILEKDQNPWTFIKSLRALKRLMRRLDTNVLHAHLSWDHQLSRVAAREGILLARTYHSRRVLRSDPFASHIFSRTHLPFIINDRFRDAALFHGRQVYFTPPPLDLRQFKPEGGDARQSHGIGADETVIGYIGKISPGRGFEDAIRTFALVRRLIPSRMLIIGRGSYRRVLEQLVDQLQIGDAVTWAGYHEDEDLARHFRAANVFLFTAKGSDEGHRAVLEASGCGAAVCSYPIEGVEALLPPSHMSVASTPEALADVVVETLQESRETLRSEAVARAKEFSYPAAAQRLLSAYQSAMQR
jgi:glycosyltransferase involved in cell wall biosynthesis